MTLEESIAKLNLGALTISQMPQMARNALEHGITSESLIILAGMSDKDNAFEVQQYLNQTIEELGIKSHQSLNAAYVLANSYVNKVKDGKLNVIQGIFKIKNECWDNCSGLIERKVYLLDQIQFEGLLGPWYEYYEIDEQTEWVRDSGKSLKQIKSEIESDLAQSLLKWQTEFLTKEIQHLTK